MHYIDVGRRINMCSMHATCILRTTDSACAAHKLVFFGWEKTQTVNQPLHPHRQIKQNHGGNLTHTQKSKQYGLKMDKIEGNKINAVRTLEKKCLQNKRRKQTLSANNVHI